MIYGIDTETDNDGNTAWIVQWAIVDAKGHGWAGTDYNDLKDRLLRFLDKKGKTYLYAHNLDYDFHFIKGILMDIAENYNVNMQIIARYGKVISVTLTPKEDSQLSDGMLIIRDSLKKIPGSSVRSLGKLIGLPKLEGVSEDFHPGWSKEIDFSNPDEWEYVKRDAQIVAAVMDKMHSRAGGNRTKSTASGDAWMLMKKFIGTDSKGRRFKNDLRWQRLFPKLSTELDIRLRKGYTGGLNISLNRGITEGPLTHADVHSMYPSVMSYDPLPFGEPTISCEMPHDGALFIAEVRIKMKLKDNSIPWFSFKQGYDNIIENIPHGTQIEDTHEWHEMTLTNVDIDILMDWYNLEFDPDYTNLFFIFKQKIGIFAGYIEHYMKEKEKAAKGGLEYTMAKLAMNSGYGRMALARETEDARLEWDNEICDYMIKSEPTINDDTENYLPYAMFVTSYARARLLEYCKAVIDAGEQIIHCDTDSCIHTGGLIPGVDYGDHLGQWGIESHPLRICEGGFKRYMEQLNEPVKSQHDYAIACAGVPQRENHLGVPIGMWIELLDDPELIKTSAVLGQKDYRIKSQWLRDLYIKNGMNPDSVNTFKLIPRKVPGGIILEERQHTLSDNLTYRFRR